MCSVRFQEIRFVLLQRVEIITADTTIFINLCAATSRKKWSRRLKRLCVSSEITSSKRHCENGRILNGKSFSTYSVFQTFQTTLQKIKKKILNCKNSQCMKPHAKITKIPNLILQYNTYVVCSKNIVNFEFPRVYVYSIFDFLWRNVGTLIPHLCGQVRPF